MMNATARCGRRRSSSASSESQSSVAIRGGHVQNHPAVSSRALTPSSTSQDHACTNAPRTRLPSAPRPTATSAAAPPTCCRPGSDSADRRLLNACVLPASVYPSAAHPWTCRAGWAFSTAASMWLPRGIPPAGCKRRIMATGTLHCTRSAARGQIPWHACGRTHRASRCSLLSICRSLSMFSKSRGWQPGIGPNTFSLMHGAVVITVGRNLHVGTPAVGETKGPG